MDIEVKPQIRTIHPKLIAVTISGEVGRGSGWSKGI